MFFQHFSRTPTAKYKKKKKKIYLPTYPIFFGTVTGNKQFFFLGLSIGRVNARNSQKLPDNVDAIFQPLAYF